MKSHYSRREFVHTLSSATAALALTPALCPAAGAEAFSFVLLGDLHYDQLQHHDLAWLEKEKPDDLRQVRDYSRISAENLPRLLTTVRETIADLARSADSRVAFTAQLGDWVEGLCGSETLARRQNADAIQCLRDAKLGVPFLFTKGNHDITGEGAPAAFKSVFWPFLDEQLSACGKGAGQRSSARYTLEVGNALFCFFDAYDPESLPWLEAALAKRSSQHCFVLLHPPVVPYGARSTWHLFAGERQQASRERILELLGKNNAIVLTAHIHKYSFLERATSHAGRFVQLGLGSVMSSAEVKAGHVLKGVDSYTPDQVTVEPNFSPSTQAQRRAVYEAEMPAVKQFEYADLPAYAVLTVDGSRVNAKVFSGFSRQVWRSLDLGLRA